MGYKSCSQLFVGIRLFDILEEIMETHTVEVKDYLTDKFKGTKQISKRYYRLGNDDFDNLWDIEKKLKELGLFIFYTVEDFVNNRKDIFIGIGWSTTYNNSVISTNIEELLEKINLIKPILESLGYKGEIGVYSILNESY